MPTRFSERRATRRAEAANTDVMEGEPKTTKTAKAKGFASTEEREEAIAKAEVETKAKAEEAKTKEVEALAAVPPEPVVLPKWKPTVLPNKIEDKEKTVGDWIIQGITAIVDEHKLISLTAWRDVSGNVVVEYVEDPRAMYSLRKEPVAKEAKA